MEIKKNKQKPYELKERTKAFALRVIRLYTSLPRDGVSQVIGKQILRSGTSVGANYREATRGRSDAEFISKVEIALQELEETRYWMELIVESEIFSKEKIKELQEEADELVAILTSSVKTVKNKNKQSTRNDKC
jgi:four helix bundle protein